MSLLKLFHLLSQGAAGVCGGSVCVSQHSGAKLASVCLRMDRFVEAEATATAAPAFTMTSASRARPVSFALLVLASVTCTTTTTFKVQGTIKKT